MAPATAEQKHVHRGLKRGDRGADVRQLQHGINHKAATWKLDQFAVEVDGQLGKQTEDAATHLLYAMGAYGKVLQRARKGALSEFGQRLLRGSRGRDKRMRALSRSRRGELQRWRKNANPLRERAYRIARTLEGVSEEGGNNTGKVVDKIILSNGGYIGEPWCGDAMAYCYRNAGSKAVTRSWASVSLLGGVLGVKRTSSPKRGDLVRYTFDHVGMFVRDLGNGEIETLEGNTGDSGAVSDSVTGHDGFKRKVRPKSLVEDYLRVTR